MMHLVLRNRTRYNHGMSEQVHTGRQALEHNSVRSISRSHSRHVHASRYSCNTLFSTLSIADRLTNASVAASRESQGEMIINLISIMPARVEGFSLCRLTNAAGAVVPNFQIPTEEKHGDVHDRRSGRVLQKTGYGESQQNPRVVSGGEGECETRLQVMYMCNHIEGVGSATSHGPARVLLLPRGSRGRVKCKTARTEDATLPHPWNRRARKRHTAWPSRPSTSSLQGRSLLRCTP
jgi:hypothetical protein